LALQAVLVVIGVCSFCIFGWLQFEQYYVGSRYLERFDSLSASPRKDGSAEVSPSAPSTRVASARSQDPALLARLRIPRLDLEAPVLDGADERALRRGAGWIHGTARPGEAGNVAIAAHRDTFFRSLRDIRSGDRIELDLPDSSRTYVVQSVYVVEPDFKGAFEPTDEPTLTLVTCFPFYFVGPAPRRYIVQAVGESAD
jgi:LPXTG-site transpeptidase (sortase) family protein